MKLLFIGARLFDDVAVYTKNGHNTVLTESNPQAQNLDLAILTTLCLEEWNIQKTLQLKKMLME